MTRVYFNDATGELFAALDFLDRDRLNKRMFDTIAMHFDDRSLVDNSLFEPYKLPFNVTIETKVSKLELYVDYLPFDDGSYYVCAYRKNRYGNFDIRKDKVYSKVNRPYDYVGD